MARSHPDHSGFSNKTPSFFLISNKGNLHRCQTKSRFRRERTSFPIMEAPLFYFFYTGQRSSGESRFPPPPLLKFASRSRQAGREGGAKSKRPLTPSPQNTSWQRQSPAAKPPTPAVSNFPMATCAHITAANFTRNDDIQTSEKEKNNFKKRDSSKSARERDTRSQCPTKPSSTTRALLNLALAGASPERVITCRPGRAYGGPTRDGRRRTASTVRHCSRANIAGPPFN